MVDDRIKAIFTIMVLLAWLSLFIGYGNCVEKCEESNCYVDCLFWFIKESPPIKEAEEIAKACDDADLDCMTKLGEKAITKKLQEDE